MVIGIGIREIRNILPLLDIKEKSGGFVMIEGNQPRAQKKHGENQNRGKDEEVSA